MLTRVPASRWGRRHPRSGPGCVGADTAAEALIFAGDNPVVFAPNRVNRGGHHQANGAL